MVELLTITVKTFFWLVDIGGIVDQFKRKFQQWWSTILLISTHQKKVWTVMVNNSSNINKTKETFNSDGQWPSLFKLSFVLLILVELLTITVKTFFCFVDIGGIVDHHCSNFLLVCWYWRNCWPQPISTNQKKVSTVMVNNSSNINTPKESLNSDGQQFLQY
jgi:hypothetical protein